jgi:hypothetical protein
MKSNILSRSEIQRLSESLTLHSPRGAADPVHLARVVYWIWRARADGRERAMRFADAVLRGDLDVSVGKPHPGRGFGIGDNCLHFSKGPNQEQRRPAPRRQPATVATRSKKTRSRPSSESIVTVLMTAAEQAGVEFRLSDGRIRVKGPLGVRTLVRAVFKAERHFVAVFGLNWAGPGDHDKPYDPETTYLTDAEIEGCRLLRERLRNRRTR